MRKILVAWSIFSLYLIKVGVAAPQSEKVESDLTVLLRTTFGEQPRGTLSVRSATGKIVYSGDAEGKVTIRVPYDEYTATFKTPLFRRVTRQIVVDRPEVLAVLAATGEAISPERVILGVPSGDVPSGQIAVTLSVTPLHSCSNGLLWARLTGVYSEYFSDRLIKPAGEVGVALFEPVERGTYVITVVDGDRIRAVGSVEAIGKLVAPIKLVLNSCK
jgi:hypothetical protein